MPVPHHENYNVKDMPAPQHRSYNVNPRYEICNKKSLSVNRSQEKKDSLKTNNY